jgi:site-specific DNA-cytosine methylase
MLSYVEKTFTLAATQDQYVAQPVHTPASEVAPTITSSGPPYSRTGNQRVETEALVTVTNSTHIAFQPGNLVRRAGANPSTEAFPTLSKDSGDQNPHIATEMVVRRITPREAERLQGFPDDWTMIPWNGKPAEECPDGHRYKACGNSMATPVMRWIGLRLAFVDSVLQSKVCRTTSESSQTHSSNEQS